MKKGKVPWREEHDPLSRLFRLPGEHRAFKGRGHSSKKSAPYSKRWPMTTDEKYRLLGPKIRVRNHNCNPKATK